MKARSEASSAIFETVKDLYDGGIIDKETLHTFSARCHIPEVPVYGAEEIHNLRTKLNISQAVMASLLNATTSTVQKWEQGLKRPSGIAMKLLNVLDKGGINALL